MTQAEGQEILVLDGDPRVQRGLDQLLRAAGLLPTTLADPQRALELASTKFYSVMLVDLDTPEPDAGLELLARLHERSPASQLVAMAPRRSFDSAVLAFRAGADDVVVKTPDQVEYLKQRVVELAAARRSEDESERLMNQTVALHDELLQVLVNTHRRAAELEEQAGLVSVPVDEITLVLLVEDDGWLQGRLQALLEERGGYDLRAVSTGGEALDLAGRRRFHIALVKASLPDLPGSMVVRTIKAQASDTLVLQFDPPHAGRAGSVEVVEGQRVIPFLPSFTDPAQLAERFSELREAFHATSRERRHLAAFRQQHFDLLRRYAELKQKLQQRSGRS